MSNWTLLTPYWLCLMPVALAFFYRRYRLQSGWARLWPNARLRFPLVLDRDTTPTKAHHYQPMRELILLCAFILFCIALAQPVQTGQRVERPQNSDPIDAVLLVDTNITMVLRDYFNEGKAVQRMAITRELLSGFVREFNGQRLGLSIMGNPPYHWLPYTRDFMAVDDAIQRITPTLGGRLSDLSASLKLVSQRYTSDLNKIVIMVTDSSLQLGAEPPELAAELLASKGFTLYVIAIGSTSIEPEQIEQAGFVYEPVDLKLLSEVAAKGAGTLFHAQSIDTFKAALTTIAQRHAKAETPPDSLHLVTVWYPLPLVMAMVLALWAVVSERPLLNRRRRT